MFPQHLTTLMAQYILANMPNNFISIAEYCKDTGHTPQNVYRWIRESKLKEPDIQIQEKITKVVTIKKDLILKKLWGHPKNQSLKQILNP
jgi:hypothetical protein